MVSRTTIFGSTIAIPDSTFDHQQIVSMIYSYVKMHGNDAVDSYRYLNDGAYEVTVDGKFRRFIYVRDRQDRQFRIFEIRG